MFRKITGELLAWKTSEYRKPLILQGARQVGKTYAVLEFGRENYESVVYINLEDKKTHRLFEDSIDPKVLIPKLSGFTKKTITKGNTLLFIDEIQTCPPALTSLKYFCELAPEYHVIAAGSLLGVAVNREEHSFPVGKVNLITLYPMDIEEFLIATGNEELVGRIKYCFKANTPMDSYYHNYLLEQYRIYLVVGGLPECIAKYCETGNFELIRATQNEILTSYLNDMSKYNSKGVCLSWAKSKRSRARRSYMWIWTLFTPQSKSETTRRFAENRLLSARFRTKEASYLHAVTRQENSAFTPP